MDKWSTYTKPQLMLELRERDLKTTGVKSELINRLIEYDKTKQGCYIIYIKYDGKLCAVESNANKTWGEIKNDLHMQYDIDASNANSWQFIAGDNEKKEIMDDEILYKIGIISNNVLLLSDDYYKK